MDKQQRNTEGFKIAAVKQVTERQHPVTEVADRLDVLLIPLLLPVSLVGNA